MKNYEIKSAMAELSAKEKIKINSRRIAFLVPDVFRKLTKGFLKKAALAGQVAIGTVALGVGAVGHGIATAGKAIGNGVQNLAANVSGAVKEAANDAVQARDEYNTNKIASINETVERKEEKVAEIKTNANLSDNDKNYIIKAYESDIEKLRNKTIKVANAPRRLLISTMFIQKLFANRRKKKAERKAAEIARAEEMLRELPTVDEVAPTVETTTPVVEPTPVATTPVTPVAQSAEEKNVDAAIQRYIELNNERNNILDEKRVAQERLAVAEANLTRCQNEMQKLVTEYGLTQEMVESRFTR